MFFLVITHQYGRDGRESKKIDNKALMFDFSFFEQLGHPDFVTQLQHELDHFVSLLNANITPGNFIFIILKIIGGSFNYHRLHHLCLFAEKNSPHTQQNDVKTVNVATVSTSEPSITISLAFEVFFYLYNDIMLFAL